MILTLIAKSPLEQFEIVTIIPLNFLGYNFSFTNSSLFLLMSAFLLILKISLSFYKSSLIPNR